MDEDKESQKFMRSNLDRYLEVSQDSQIGWWEADMARKRYLFSDNISKLLGLKDNAIAFNKIDKYIPEDYQDIVKRDFYEYSSIKRNFNDHVIPFKLAHGIMWVKTHFISYVQGPGGEGTFGSMQIVPAPEEAKLDDSGKAKSAKTASRGMDMLTELGTISVSLSDFMRGGKEETIVTNILKSVRDIFNASNAYMFEFRPDGLSQECVYEVVPKDAQSSIIKRNKRLDNAQVPYVSKKILSGQSVIVSSLSTLPEEADVDIALMHSYGLKSFMSIPLNSGNKIWGYMGVATDKNVMWSKEDYSWLATISNIIGLCIELHRSREEHRRVLQQKERDEERFTYIYKNIPIGEGLYDTKGRIVGANQAFMKIFGFSDVSDISKYSILNDANVTDELRTKFLGKEDIFDFSAEYKFGTNPKVYCSTRKGKALINFRMMKLYEDGKLSGYLLIAIEETDHLMAINKLKDFEDLFSMIADYAKVGYAKMDLLNYEGYAIKQWYKNMGEDENTPLKSIIGVYRNMHPDDRSRLLAFFDDVRKGKAKSFTGEIRIRRAGSDKWNWIYKNLMINRYDPKHGHIDVVGVNYDITRFKEAQEELIEARDRAQAMDKLKSAFLANMSHEIRTPLNAIVGFSDLIMETDDADEKSQYMALVKENNELLLQLISDILDLSKMEAGMVELSYSNVDINSLCCDIESTMRLKIKNDVLLAFESKGSKCVINTDKIRLTQVITNFIGNAIKFTPVGSIKFGYEWVDNKHIRFYVADTGKGIEEENLSKVFDRFVKLNRFVQGTGLGLPICRTIVEQMGGKIGLNSKFGEGSTFWFVVPAANLA
jgi:signal transduction histidine kinase